LKRAVRGVTAARGEQKAMAFGASSKRSVLMMALSRAAGAARRAG